jgi:polysaccharide biosynthesis/export protein
MKRMNKFILALIVTIVAASSAAYGQAKAGAGGGQPKDLVAAQSSMRARVLGESRDLKTPASTSLNHSAPRAGGPLSPGLKTAAESDNRTRPRTGATKAIAGAALPLAPHQIYRIGVGDVLDVRLLDMPTSKSTLFTVLEGGLLDYPLSSAPVAVVGLTAEEIEAQLQNRIKVLDNPKVSVQVRDYSSHSVIVTGLVLDPGAKFLRREVTPLYVVLAEAQPRAEAVKATITRNGLPVININLKDQSAVGALVMPGDVIKVLAPPAEPTSFFYASGAVNFPGQKAFHNGLTLTQAIIASGGVTRMAGNKVKVSRQGTDGRLNTTEYNLRQIEEGKSADPVLLQGDRIAVGDGR